MAWDPADPHRGQPPLVAGAPADSARAAVVALHGRGASPEDIIGLARAAGGPGFALVAPRAASGTWYPHSFLEPLERNQPWLDSALGAVGSAIDDLHAAGLPLERILLMGFSQGGCLAAEYAARNARRYGGLAALSGGLIGPPGTPREYPGSLLGTPVFLGCSDVDPHIPAWRVEESAEVLGRLGADVSVRLYAGLGHMVGEDEVEQARLITGRLL